MLKNNQTWHGNSSCPPSFSVFSHPYLEYSHRRDKNYLHPHLQAVLHSLPLTTISTGFEVEQKFLQAENYRQPTVSWKALKAFNYTLYCASRIMFEPPSEVWTKPRGRPRNSWVRTVTNDLANSYTGLSGSKRGSSGPGLLEDVYEA